MPLNVARVRQHLQNFDFRSLFIQELGWDKHPAKLSVAVDGTTYTLQPVAEKRGFQVFECPAPKDGNVPDHATRGKIERQAAKSAHEHIIIYTDAAKSAQKWQWVRRELGRPLARREYDFAPGQTGELFAQKLQYLAVDLADEEQLTLVDVTRRARQAFDVDRVTKRFYDRFKTEHESFLKFIKGITAVADAEWYASLMLNRLMFIYFVQKKGFLDGDHDYLRNRLGRVQSERGKDKFHSFYRYFLIRLFHEGLGQPAMERKKELEKLLGTVPYLNGGLFDVHDLERTYPDIQISDDAFVRLFDFFDAYQWHLDERPLRADNEINPDVLGYIFEKYINQKQMGAYYTKEDITGYITRNTLIPFLFNVAETKSPLPFRPDSPLWRLLRDDPDRYIYPAMLHGVDLPLPPEIAAGLTDVSKRTAWNKPAPTEHALSTETWREHVARCDRCHELRAKLKAGHIHDINDLITFNLDIAQFAQDVIANSEGPDLLRAFYRSIAGHIPDKSHHDHQPAMSVLDPTCGSGAFLFAALNLLQPLYETCLDRMQGFLEDFDTNATKQHPENLSDFRNILDEVALHANRPYFILKSIIIGNLYGVDIMEEAVEICKLRLFLKLIAQVEKVDQIEPLPDIDFNIRAGNTLVGFVSLDELTKQMEGTLGLFQDDLTRVVEEAETVDRAFKRFRQMQTRKGMQAKEFIQAKTELRHGLNKLRAELDRYLAGEYAVDPEKPKAFQTWCETHQPFHWFAEFYGNMASGGFDVIIGNPPYKELRAVTEYKIRGLATVETKNLYPPVMERCLQFSGAGGRLGFIVPVSSISTEGYKRLQDVLFQYAGHFSSYDDRPSRLFDGLEHIQLTIHLLQHRAVSDPTLSVTECYRWNAAERSLLFAKLQYEAVERDYLPGSLAKLSRAIEHSILRKIWTDNITLGEQQTKLGTHVAYYSRKVHNFLQSLDFVPEVYDGQGKLRAPTELKELRFTSAPQAALVFCLLNSSLFRWFINVFSDCRHVNKREVEGFRIDLSRALASKSDQVKWLALAKRLSKRLKDTADVRSMRFAHDHLRVQCIIPKHSKDIIDDIDVELGGHFSFTDEEIEFIVNYAIKYRMGRATDDEED